jgi:hypothetical protein
MSKDKLTDHPDDVVVVAGVTTAPARPSVVRKPAVAHPARRDAPEPAASPSSSAPSHRHQPFKGRPAERKDHVLQVCRILRTALNDHGDTWGSFSAPPAPADDPADGIVATATDQAGVVLRVQVSRVDRPAAKTMARGDAVVRRRSVGQRVTDIRRAMDAQIRHHPAAGNGELLLALDAIRSPEHVEPAVVQAFLAAHHASIAPLGYRAIWLVGPTGDMSHRLG